MHDGLAPPDGDARRPARQRWRALRDLDEWGIGGILAAGGERRELGVVVLLYGEISAPSTSLRIRWRRRTASGARPSARPSARRADSYSRLLLVVKSCGGSRWSAITGALWASGLKLVAVGSTWREGLGLLLARRDSKAWRNANGAFTAPILDYKNLVRMRLAANGSLTLHRRL